MIKMVAFDLDGTIAETIPMCIEVFKRAVLPYTQRMLSKEEVVNTFGLNEEGMINKVVTDHISAQDALKNYHNLYAQMHHLCEKPFPYIRQLFDNLKQKDIILAMVTGKGAESCEISLQKFDLKHYFVTVKTGSKHCTNKAVSLAELLLKYQLKPNEIIYVGDTVSDVHACNEVGIKCLSVAWAESAIVEDLRAINPDHVYETVQLAEEYIFSLINEK
ncbi:HAD hydrolase-like protein [Lentisphaerota bacterium WC36G]|nr:HAD family hydrolase [Lentisphaerae bacterium WC36]